MRKKYSLVCINNGSLKIGQKIQSLTVGMTYFTYDKPYYNDVCVINDLGNEVNYSSSRFVTLEVWRERRLNKVLDSNLFTIFNKIKKKILNDYTSRIF